MSKKNKETRNVIFFIAALILAVAVITLLIIVMIRDEFSIKSFLKGIFILVLVEVFNIPMHYFD